jgi:hypothetical protein
MSLVHPQDGDGVRQVTYYGTPIGSLKKVDEGVSYLSPDEELKGIESRNGLAVRALLTYWRNN